MRVPEAMTTRSQPTARNLKADVMIAGGGIAGLACGAALAGIGLKVNMFEAEARLGGRACTFQDARTGDAVDIGPHVVTTEHRNFLALMERLGDEAGIDDTPSGAAAVPGSARPRDALARRPRAAKARNPGGQRAKGATKAERQCGAWDRNGAEHKLAIPELLEPKLKTPAVTLPKQGACRELRLPAAGSLRHANGAHLRLTRKLRRRLQHLRADVASSNLIS
jgi:phytoene dehydrogenase-like protein